MKLYSENKDYKLYHGNMLDMLEVIEPNTIDSVITDPPYELNFMGKGWDNSGIAFQKETWQKCYEVLKPGGYLLAFGGSRTFHRIACAIEDAGFEIRDTIMWLYGSGFPKSMDISKSLDKRNGRNPNIDFKEYLNMKRKEKNYSLADINKMMNVATNGGGFASSIMGKKENIILPTKENYLKLKEILDLDNRYDELINTSEAEREVIGKKESGCFNNQETNRYTIGSSKSLEVDITIPSTELGKKWQGWGTCLKPSFEPIIVARKPFKGSLVDNVIDYGVGGINIDECRVGNEVITQLQKDMTKYHGNKLGAGHHTQMTGIITQTIGRFPANTILTYDDTDFDEVCGGFPNIKSIYNKDAKHETEIYRENADTLKYGYKTRIDSSSYNDSGSASRYFMNCKYTGKDEEFRRYIYTPKASKKDRDEGCQELEDTVNACSNQAIAELKRGNNNFSDEKNSTFNKVYVGKNTHPTVKPTELMQYLIRLVSPNGATILDPFNGSGSTGKAVMYENKERNKNYKYIGIELTEEYLPISKARIECLNTKEETKQDMPAGQTNIFDFIKE